MGVFELTKEQRLQVYKLALKEALKDVKNGETPYLCVELEWALSKLEYSGDLMEVLPEFEAYRPEGKCENVAWWEDTKENADHRINILREIIEKLKK